jgi:formate dehydrogenase iron-sulfur subunit
MVSILFDITKCSGCERCVSACITCNNLNIDKANSDRATIKDGLSANRLLSIIKIDQGRFARLSCMHCLEPSCVSACLVGGLTKSPEGPVLYDPDKCIGCRYCMLACPFHIPRYEWDRTRPFVKKCVLCYDKVKQGEIPACVNACPNNAILSGERNDLLRYARKIINTKKSKYLSHIWGEKEFGGTSVLYISDVDLVKMGWPKQATVAIPHITEPLIEKTPFIGLTVAGCLVGLNWIIKRRMELTGKNLESENKVDKSHEQNIDQ